MTLEDRKALQRWEEHHKALAADVPVEDWMSKRDIEKRRMELEKDPIAWIRYFFRCDLLRNLYLCKVNSTNLKQTQSLYGTNYNNATEWRPCAPCFKAHGNRYQVGNADMELECR